MDQNPFISRMEKMTDDQLKEAIWIHSEDYTDEALAAAKLVATQRGITSNISETKTDEQQSPSDNAPIYFEGYLKAVDFRLVEKKLYSTFKEPDKVVEKLREVYQQLLSLEPKIEEPPVYLFLAQLTEEYDGRYPFGLFGIEDDSSEPFGLEMLPWSEWLGLKVFDKTRVFIERLGIEEFIALCLRKMTVLGYTEEEIEQKIQMISESDFDFDEEDDSEDIY